MVQEVALNVTDRQDKKAFSIRTIDSARTKTKAGSTYRSQATGSPTR